MVADPVRDIAVTQSLTGARDSTVIGLAETVNVAYNLLPEDTRAHAKTQQVFQQINQLIQQLNQQLKDAENKRLSQLLTMNIERYIQLGGWSLYGLGLLAALHPLIAVLALLLILVALLGLLVFAAAYTLDYRRAGQMAQQTRQQIDAYLKHIDPNFSLAVAQPYRSATRFPMLSGSRRWQLIQVVFLTLGGFALITLLMSAIGASEAAVLTDIVVKALVFLISYTLVLMFASNMRLRAEKIKLQLFTEDHLFHIRFGAAAESYAQAVNLTALVGDVGVADGLPRPIIAQERAEPMPQPPGVSSQQQTNQQVGKE